MNMQFAGNEPKGESSNDVPGQEQTQEAETGYVTPDQLAAFKKEIDEKMSNLYRGIQSQTDKLSFKVQQRMEAYERAANAQGLTLTPSQKQQLHDQTTIEELRAVSQAETSKLPPDPVRKQGESADKFVERVNQAAETMLEIAGITLEENDPEVEMINKAAEGTAEQYLDAHREAIRLKKERLALGEKEPSKRPPAGGAPGSIPGSPNTNPIANVTDPDELWRLAQKQGKF